jgi:hypothetical protein
MSNSQHTTKIDVSPVECGDADALVGRKSLDMIEALGVKDGS